MLKMFSTQLTGVFKKIAENEEFSFEDGARLLAQATAGDGYIYIFGAKEMRAVPAEAIDGAEPLRSAKELTAENLSEVTDADRVLLFTRTSNDNDTVQLAERLAERRIPFVAVSTVLDEGKLTELADVHIDLRLTRGLLPDETGGRFGIPASMAALFVYYGLKFTIDEILAEYEE
ncbi:DUF2529 domain-containing protein [Neobacillus dielmonensis]|uniref:DUF2529 domain-containing protein n=1 Tax=Neobacillus dielmonensis TaxID=1347369 RepID=UPI0005AB1E63|nr:DUF2529 domain-containing protein [Neobacillus dielmonensis]